MWVRIPSPAQETEAPSRDGLAWLTAGAGIGTGEGAVALGPDVAWDEHILSARAAFQPMPVLGFGTYLLGNLNLEHPFGGPVVTVNLGWLE